MLTILSFFLTILGCINWLCVGLLQYDFVAGIFGFQASVFSRIIYIIIGSASLFLVFKLIKGKGTIAVFSRRNKQDLKKQIGKIGNKAQEKINIEAGEDTFNRHQKNKPDEFYQRENFNSDYIDEDESLFDEHFRNTDK